MLLIPCQHKIAFPINCKECFDEAVQARVDSAQKEVIESMQIIEDMRRAEAVKEAVARAYEDAAKIADNLGAEDARNAILFRSRSTSSETGKGEA